MEYTKGEWTADKTVTGAEVGVDDDVIADVYSCHTGIALANANLIAAAPDMYEALSQLRNDSQWAKLRPNTREAIIKALAKAEE